MKISEVSDKHDLSPDTLRYYEKIGLIPPVKKNGSGVREYTERDLRWIEYIKCMRAAGVAVEQLAAYVQLFQEGDETIDARKQILREQRAQIIAKMAELQETLDMLDYKIERYDHVVLRMEQELAKGDHETR